MTTGTRFERTSLDPSSLEFLPYSIPRRYAVRLSTVVSPAGTFSRTLDILIVEESHNTPLGDLTPLQRWPLESVYALLDVKGALTFPTLRTAVSKCQAFKSLERSFVENHSQNSTGSIYTLWAFELESVDDLEETLRTVFRDVPARHRPDLIVVPNRCIVLAGEYLEQYCLGRPGSPQRLHLSKLHGANLRERMSEFLLHRLGEDSLMAWLYQLDSWLRQAGSRRAGPLRYVPTLDLWESASALESLTGRER